MGLGVCEKWNEKKGWERKKVAFIYGSAKERNVGSTSGQINAHISLRKRERRYANLPIAPFPPCTLRYDMSTYTLFIYTVSLVYVAYHMIHHRKNRCYALLSGTLTF